RRSRNAQERARIERGDRACPHGARRHPCIPDADRVRAANDGIDRADARRGEVAMIGFLIYLFLVGIVAGFLARLLGPGRDPLGFWATVLLGIVGSFVGGFLGYVIFGKDIDEGALQASGIVGSIIGAIIALLIYRAVSGSRRGRLMGR